MRDHFHSKTRQRPAKRETGNLEPHSSEVEIFREAARAVIPIGMAAAAAMATFSRAPQRVLVTMWVSFAVVGTAAVIASARRPRGFT